MVGKWFADKPNSNVSDNSLEGKEVKPVIKAIISPDVGELETYFPDDQNNFGFLLQLLIGPEKEEGAESFMITVCTPQWLSTRYDIADIIIGRHYLIMFEYNRDRLMDRIQSAVSQCVGDNWEEVALKLARFGYWEFED